VTAGRVGEPDPRSASAPRAILLVVAAASLFGTVGTARVLGPSASSWSVGVVRLVLAAAVLSCLAVLAGPGGRAVRACARAPSAWVAGAGQAAFQVTFLAAVERTGVAVGTLVAIGSAPLFAGAITRRVSAAWLVATGIAVTGLAMLALGGGGPGGGGAGDGFGGAGGPDTAGIALAAGAGLSYATYTVAIKRLVDARHEPAATGAAAFGWAALLLCPALLLTDLGWVITGDGALMAGYLVLGPTVLAYLLFNSGLRTLPARTVSSLGLTEPVVAATLGILVLGERLGGPALLGGLLVLAGLALLARATVRAARDDAASPEPAA